MMISKRKFLKPSSFERNDKKIDYKRYITISISFDYLYSLSCDKYIIRGKLKYK